MIYLATAIWTLIQNRNRILDEKTWDQVMSAIVLAALFEILMINNWQAVCKILLVPITFCWIGIIVLNMRNQMEHIQ